LGFAGFVVAAPLLGTLFKGLGKKERRQAQETAPQPFSVLNGALF
jgi:hypothetical protein